MRRQTPQADSCRIQHNVASDGAARTARPCASFRVDARRTRHFPYTAPRKSFHALGDGVLPLPGERDGRLPSSTLNDFVNGLVSLSTVKQRGPLRTVLVFADEEAAFTTSIF